MQNGSVGGGYKDVAASANSCNASLSSLLPLVFFLFLILFLEFGHVKLTTHHPSAFPAALKCKGYLAAEPLACVHQTQAILIRLFAFNITLPGSISKPCCPPMAINADTGDEPM